MAEVVRAGAKPGSDPRGFKDHYEKSVHVLTSRPVISGGHPLSFKHSMDWKSISHVELGEEEGEEEVGEGQEDEKEEEEDDDNKKKKEKKEITRVEEDNKDDNDEE